MHRDLKPENIFITRDGVVKILDFGLAKLTDQREETASLLSTSPQTTPGAVLGTFSYMSPEQARGKEVDHRSDIFSFGAVLYEMSAGKRAFPGASFAEVVSAILRDEPATNSAVILTLFPALRTLPARIELTFSCSAIEYVAPSHLARIYLALKQPDRAFQELDRAIAEKNVMLYLRSSPEFDSIRPDPRFSALLQRLGL